MTWGGGVTNVQNLTYMDTLQNVIYFQPRLLDSPEWAVMCAVDFIPAIKLPDFLCDDFENLDKLVMAGEVFLAAGKAERLEELCDLLKFPNMLKEEVMDTVSSAEETVEAVSSGHGEPRQQEKV